MTYAAVAAWLRPRLGMGLVIGITPWLAWIASLALGGWYKDAFDQLITADHLAFYHAARLVREGHEHRLYNYGELNATNYQRQLIGWEWDGFEAFRNPPFYALLYWPTAGLSYYHSAVIWLVIGGVLWVGAIGLLRPAQPLRVWMWSLTFYPVCAVVGFGQNTFVSLAIMAGVYRLLQAERKFAAGWVAGLLFFKPQLLLGFFVWWGMEPRRYARTWGGVVLMGATLAALSAVVLPAATRAFVHSLPEIAAFRGDPFWNKQSPRAFWALLLARTGDEHQADDQAPLVLALAGICSLAAIAGAWWVKQRTGAPVAVMFPIAIFLSLWASPHSLIYEWALLVAAAIVVWDEFPSQRDAWLVLFALAWIGLGISTTLAAVQLRAQWPVVLQVAVPVIGLVGALAAREWVRAIPAQR
ncbi:MAG: glycosyltransferase family 87 protein [Gemmataceae bacterium]|nr:DUF2029 domain-containing protein [Gemmata sp.]MDW8198987.1 glycosyltransferase family 87 protein [Gemmataceae bacterium]